MAVYTGPKCRLCRREGMKLFIKGERCHTNKCAITKRGDNYPPGMQGWKRPRKPSEYGMQLREKQRLKRIYGILERQFRRMFSKAQAGKGNTGSALLQLMERRLDNVVRASGLAFGPSAARQMVTHGLVHLNGRRVDVPSILVKTGDVVSVAPRDRTQALVKGIVEATSAYQNCPGWLERDGEKLTVKVLNLPTREEFPLQIREQLIVEGCSK
ncbi:MAG: 30S ribosomal protein S4 [Planctomycetes bacterium]|nr:30S ribosomal protein S4 [Planctomycetota bacterium]